MTLGTRVVVMKDGVIQQVGPPLEVFRRPTNRFVATFIGAPAMNLFAGVIADDGGSVEIEGGGRIKVDGHHAPGTKITLGIRPQHLIETADGLECRVRVCEPLGDETDVMLDGPGEVSITARLRLDQVPNAGSTMRVGVLPANTHLFERESGERIETEAAVV